MNNVLITILSLSLSGSLLIIIISVLKLLFKEHLSKRWQYYIWLVVIARLLLPFAPAINLTGSLFQGMSHAVVTDFESLWQNSSASNSNTNNGLDSVTQTTDVLYSQSNTFKVLLSNIWLIWIVVALILFIRKVTIYQSFARYIKAGCTEVSDFDKLEQLGQIAAQLNIKRAIGIYTNPLISSPLLIGFFRAYIVLPTLEVDNSDFRYTVLHELTHYKRRDMFYKWLVQLTICLHWFNPFVYFLGREINRTCELSCDEAIIKKQDYQGMREYGNTLLNAMGAGGNYKESIASVTLNESKELLKERLVMITKFQKKSKPVVALTLILTVLLCMGATAVGAYAAPTSASTSIPSTPWDAMGGDTAQTYTYSQSGYYQEPYIFELGWNLNEKGYKAYPDKAEIKLSTSAVMMVSFDSSCKAYAQDKEALTVLTTLIERLNTQSTLSLVKPLVVSVQYVGDSNLKKLADEYYINNALTDFSAIFSALDDETQKEYCNKMFQDNKNAFLSSNLRNMNTDLINFCAEKAYEENNNAFFTNIIPYLTNDTKQAWIERASHDKRNTFLAVLLR